MLCAETEDCVVEVTLDEKEIASTSRNYDYIPLDDTKYPYAGIPRIVVETENGQKIKDRETEIPAKLQIWGEFAPESEIMELTIRGRGNTSWGMPKKSYKIEFLDKQNMLGMPKDRDWALVPNYADKTLMKNYLMYHLAQKLGVFYAPRCEFAELYLNEEYLGVYLLVETIKISKHRVNIPENMNSYIIEIAHNYRKNDQMIFSHIIRTDSFGKPFHIHAPKKATNETLSIIKENVENFEKFLKTIELHKENNVFQKIDVGECIKYYWVQELSKNPDAANYSSIYSIWVKNQAVKMGPVWDFDLSFGSHNNESINNPKNWHVKSGYWYSLIFKDSVANQARLDFYKENRDILVETIDVADSVRNLLQNAAKNNFKRWNILNSTEFVYHRHAYDTYDDAVEDLKKWIHARIEWIDEQILGSN